MSGVADILPARVARGEGGVGGSVCRGHAESRNRLRSSRGAKHGGGVTGSACAPYPSTTLRVVPLPISDGEEF